jgi:glycerol uptake facilitator-like aquaporin
VWYFRQPLGGIAGTIAAHLMFDLPLVSVSLKARTGGAQWFAEWVATFGLIVTILAGIRFARTSVPWLVGLYITAAYWFTAYEAAFSVTALGFRPVFLSLPNCPRPSDFASADLFAAYSGATIG